jgi:hypothetical protein
LPTAGRPSPQNKSNMKMELILKEVWHSNEKVHPVVIFVDGVSRDKKWLLDNGIIVLTKKSQLCDWYRVNTNIQHSTFNTVYVSSQISEMNKRAGIAPHEWAGIQYKGVGFKTTI